MHIVFRIIKWFMYITGILLLVILGTYLFMLFSINIPRPEIKNKELLSIQIDTLQPQRYQYKHNWLKKNEYGLWEMYIEGNAEERGIIAGKLSASLIQYQEEVFVNEIRKYIPSDFYLGIMRTLVGFFNRHTYKYIPEEYLTEIYGISLSASDAYNAFGDPYLRILNYHAAHDIGHALQNYALVGCSSFALWDEKTSDSSVIAGRNFDFYFGEAFAQEKIIQFVNPTDGYPFAFITWGGMTGAVSGINQEGLSVTINAAKGGIPKKAATPVSLVSREILQYARTIEEAFEIARKRQMFVAESFLVSSAADGRAIIIEKTPTAIDSFSAIKNTIICANHFQSKAFATTAENETNRTQNATGYRFQRMEELVAPLKHATPESVAKILRDTRGIGGKDIGFGNEKTINQLIAHHSVIFNAHKKQMWISTPPDLFQEYIGYDLQQFFDSLYRDPLAVHYDPTLTIAADTTSGDNLYKRIREYNLLHSKINTSIREGKPVKASEIENFIYLNPNYYKTWEIAGDYYLSQNNLQSAKKMYEKALTKEINAKANRLLINEKSDNLKQ